MIDGLNLHWLTQMTLASGLLVLFVARAFPNNAASRRMLAQSVLLLLLILPPLLLLMGDVFWHFEMENPWPLKSFWNTYIPPLALLLWISGAGYVVLQIALGIARSLGALRRMPLLQGSGHSGVLQSLRGVAMRMGYHENVTLRLGGDQEPCSTSLGTRTVVLPRDYARWSEKTLEAVLAHELVHLARRDSWKLLLLHLVRAFYWWMPWMGTLQQEMLRSIEESCDDSAAEILGSNTEYLSGLAEVARRGLQPRPPGFESMVTVQLALRFDRFLLQRKHQLESDRVYWGVLGILCLVLLVTGINPKSPALPVVGMLQISSAASGSESPGRMHTHTFEPQSANLMVDPDALSRPANPPVIYPRVSAEGEGALQAPLPIYPGPAILAGIEGSVLVEYRVTRDGHVARVRILESKPAGVFDSSVLNALARYRYAPRLYAPQSARASPAFLRTRVTPEVLSSRFRFSLAAPI